MLLNDKTFAKVAALTGYEHAEYHAAIADRENPGKHLVKFLVYDGKRYSTTRATFVWVRENFSIESYERYRYITNNDRGESIVVTVDR